MAQLNGSIRGLPGRRWLRAGRLVLLTSALAHGFYTHASADAPLHSKSQRLIVNSQTAHPVTRFVLREERQGAAELGLSTDQYRYALKQFERLRDGTIVGPNLSDLYMLSDYLGIAPNVVPLFLSRVSRHASNFDSAMRLYPNAHTGMLNYHDLQNRTFQLATECSVACLESMQTLEDQVIQIAKNIEIPSGVLFVVRTESESPQVWSYLEGFGAWYVEDLVIHTLNND